MNTTDLFLQAFEEELSLISDIKVKEDTERCLDTVHECHLYRPASSSFKYHPDWACGRGGLILHSKGVVRLTLTMLNVVGVDYPRDYFISAGILHDLGKYWDGRPFSCKEHAGIMASTMETIGCESEIIGLVRHHMGEFCADLFGLPINEEERLFHLADYLVSRDNLLTKPI
jgi:putative nucleotidyltransferase with HDIG domain